MISFFICHWYFFFSWSLFSLSWLKQYRIAFFESVSLSFFKKESVSWRFFNRIRRFDEDLKYVVWNCKTFFSIFDDSFFVFMKWNIHGHIFCESFVISCNCECEINSIFSSFWTFFKSDTPLLFVKDIHMTVKAFEMRAETMLFCNILMLVKLFFYFSSILLLNFADFLPSADISSLTFNFFSDQVETHLYYQWIIMHICLYKKI